MKTVLLTVAILLSIISISVAQQTYPAGPLCVVFSTLDDMVRLLELWTKNQEAGSFMMGEMIANGKLKKVSEGYPVKVINAASNGVCQVLVEGKPGYIYGPSALKGYR